MKRVVIFGTGLIGTSLALALRRSEFGGVIVGVEKNAAERDAATAVGVYDEVLDAGSEVWRKGVETADVVVLAVPVLAILHWMETLAPVLREGQLLTDVGSTKQRIAERGRELFGGLGAATFLPGHPMAGKESGGATLADAELFDGAMWLFTPVAEESARTGEWRGWVERLGARVMDLEPQRHDEVCAWTSHLPQMVATALSSVLLERFGDDPVVQQIGGRAMQEMTRLGASPYSMWRDIAMTNEEAIGESLQRMEQQMAHLRENLHTPELRAMFAEANRFRLPRRR